MKRHFTVVLLIVLLAGCANTQINDKFSGSVTQSEFTNAPLLYQEYSLRVNQGLDHFRQLINSDEYSGSISALTIESRRIIGISSEGGTLTRFMTPTGEIIRYTVEQFGETGKKVSNVYVFDDGLIYVQELSMNYADWAFASPNNRFDILDYSLNSYVIDGEKTVILDDVFLQAKEDESGKKVVSLDELDDYFNKYDEEGPELPSENGPDRLSSLGEEIQAIPPDPKTLSETVYPEYILLSENFWTVTEIYSPIDHAYNQNRAQADFIDSFAGEYEIIWRRELEYQYNKCIQNMPEEYKEKFALQQLAWEEYFDNDVFPEIAQIYDEEDNNIGGYGFSREATLIRLDRVRTRTIEIMRIQTHIDGLNVAFSMENTFYPDLDHINGLFSLGDWQALFYDELSKYIDSPKAMFNICDLDGDGTPELLLSKDDYHAASGEIYTIDQGTLKHLGDYGGWGEFQYDFERNYIHSSFMAQGSTQLSIYQLENGAAVEVISFFDPYYLSMSEGEPEINGERVSPATYRAEYEKYDFASRDDFCVRKYDINESEIVRVLNFW